VTLDQNVFRFRAMSCIKCSLFEKMSSDNAGTILNIYKVNMTIVNCRFNQIQSSKYPGCFYVCNSLFILELSSFNTCYASGADANYGRITLSQYSNITVREFSAIKCGPSKSALGDSVNAFHHSNVSVDSYNTSVCYGIDGSATVSILYVVEEFTAKRINCVDCIDWNSFEYVRNTKKSYTLSSNFINSTMNSNFVIDLYYTSAYCLFRNCIFLNNHITFVQNPDFLVIVDCYSDTEIGYSISVKSDLTPFTLQNKNPKECYPITCNCGRSFFFNTFHKLLMILIFSY
jgi:hypothetical protein